MAVFLNPGLKINYYKEHAYSRIEIKEIQKVICQLYEKEYKTDCNNDAAGEEQDSEDEFYSHMFKRTVNRQPKEFQKYLQHPLSNSQVNILDYWRSQATEFPGLSRMARDYLSVQSGSVAVERDFSGGADLVTPKRCSLHSKTIQACMCMKSWYRYDSTNQG